MILTLKNHKFKQKCDKNVLLIRFLKKVFLKKRGEISNFSFFNDVFNFDETL